MFSRMIPICVFSALLLGAAIPASVMAQQGQPVPPAAPQNVPPAVPMLSGGVGEDEYDRIQESHEGYNLRLLFTQSDGAYVADVAISLHNAKGTQLASTTTEGPILFVKLKPGNYTVKSTLAGVTRSTKVSVPAKGMGHATITFPAATSD